MITQLFIALFGLTALYLSLNGGDRARRWAPFIGLAGQPFWLSATFGAGQPGMAILCLAYTMVYAIACAKQIRAWRARNIDWSSQCS